MVLRKKTFENSHIIQVVYALLAVTLPFFIFFMLFILTGNGFDITKLFPAYSDEIVWYSQLRSFVECGEIYGNYGYNGSSASMMGTGAWGFIILIPYILIGKIIGITPFTMIAANIIFISAAILTFILLVRPTQKQYLALYLSETSLYFLSLYMSISMSESLRYAMSIFVLAFIIKLFRGEGSIIYRYVIVPFVIFVCSLIFMVNVVWFPVYFFYVFRSHYAGINIAINLIGTGLIAFSVNGVIGLTSCQYLQPSTIQQILLAFKGGIGNGILKFISIFFANIHTVDLFQIVADAGQNYGITSWFFCFYLAIMIGFCVYACKNMKKKNKWHWMLGAYLMLAFLFAFCGLYTGVRWTLARGICIGLVAVMFLLSICEKNKLTYIVVLFLILSFSSFYQYSSQSFSERSVLYEEREKLENERLELENVMSLTEEGDRWGNTIAYYGQIEHDILAVPAGYGLNFIFDTNVSCKAGWAYVSKSYATEEKEKIKSALIADGYREKYESESFYVYQRAY